MITVQQLRLPRIPFRRSFLVMAFLLAGFMGAAPLYAATITVDSAADVGGAGICTLRDAIAAANTNAAVNGCAAGAAGLDLIAFNIAGAGTHVIQLASALPSITERISINGNSQSDASANTLAGMAYPNAQGLDTQIRIELDGSAAGVGVQGLNLQPGSDYSVVRGLAIVNFTSAAIRIYSSGNVIAGNFLGVHADGATAGANGNGVVCETPGGGNVVGVGTFGTVADRNLILAKLTEVHVSGSNGNAIAGNLLGTDRTGTQSLGTGSGVRIWSALSTEITDNVIAGHVGGSVGLELQGAQNSTVTGNAIGIAVGGAALGNSAGIYVTRSATQASMNNLISTNGIANSVFSGIAVQGTANGDPSGTRLDNNAIYDNGALGIDLMPQAGEASPFVTANDAGDADAGPNGLQNHPVITSAMVDGSGAVVIQFSLNSTANTQTEVSAYSNDACDASGYGEGRYGTGLLNTTVVTDASGNAGGTITVPAPLPAGWGANQFVTLLAHAVSAVNTSEFSPCAPVAAAGTPPVMGDVPDQNATVGTPFSLDVSGYVTLTEGNPITGYGIASGSLPPGLALDVAGVISGTPTAAGIYNVTVTASDTDGASNADAVQFTVGAIPNAPPVANGDTYNTAYDTALNVAAPGVLANDSDPDGDPVTAVLSIGPSHGVLSLNAAGGFTYTPTVGYSGMDSFAYVANDGTANSAQVAWVIVYVGAASPVTSYTGPTATGAGNATASFSGGGAGCTYTKSVFIPLSGGAGSPPAGSAPANYTFPFGLFDFAVGNCTPGATVTMTITYPQAVPAGAVYWKYGPTAGDTTPHWYQLPASIAGNTATFSIADGGLGDDDLAANGVIVDQGGPGVPGAPGGVAAIPTLSEWALLALTGLLGLLGMGAVRYRVCCKPVISVRSVPGR